MALVKCPCAFRLRRLAQSDGCDGSGICVQHFPCGISTQSGSCDMSMCISSVQARTKRWPPSKCLAFSSVNFHTSRDVTMSLTGKAIKKYYHQKNIPKGSKKYYCKQKNWSSANAIFHGLHKFSMVFIHFPWFHQFSMVFINPFIDCSIVSIDFCMVFLQFSMLDIRYMSVHA